jgi:outer membrane protein assembly factor BamB
MIIDLGRGIKQMKAHLLPGKAFRGGSKGCAALRAGAKQRIVSILLLAGWLSLHSLRAADWPQFLGPGRNDISSETGLLPAWSKDGPPLAWQRPIGAGFSGPAVAGDHLVLFHRLGDQEVVACLDPATGQEKWQFAYPTGYRDDFGKDEGPRSTPLLNGNRVYTLGAEGQLHCLELATGKKIWQRSLNTDYQIRKGFFGVAVSPLLEGNLLLLNVGGKEAGIVALDKDTGKETWRATNHEASYSSPVAATFHGKRRVVFFTREGVVLLDPRTGEIAYSKHWRSRMHASVNAASPVIAEDLIFVSACYGTGALLLRAGTDRIEEIWHSDDVMSNHYNTCVHSNGYLYGFDGRQEEGAQLRCVELKTGKICWKDKHTGCGSMILADGNLIILNEQGQLVLVEATPEAYREKARAHVLAAPCRSPIALANGRLYARDSKRLVCWNLKK